MNSICRMFALASLFAAGSARAQKGPVVIDINNVRRDLYKIAVPMLVGDIEVGRMAADTISGDLSVSGWFKVLDPKSFLANLAAEGTGVVVQAWRDVGAEGVSKGKATVTGGQVTLEFKLYELGRGSEAALSKSYEGSKDKARAFEPVHCPRLTSPPPRTASLTEGLPQ